MLVVFLFCSTITGVESEARCEAGADPGGGWVATTLFQKFQTLLEWHKSLGTLVAHVPFGEMQVEPCLLYIPQYNVI